MEGKILPQNVVEVGKKKRTSNTENKRILCLLVALNISRLTNRLQLKT